MCSWEQPFEQLIDTARKNIQSKHFTSVELFLQGVANSDSCFLNILTVILAGMPLTPQYVFVTAWVYRRLKFLVSTGLPYAVISISEVAISMKRTENFLKVEIKEPRNCSGTIGVDAKDITVKWHPNHPNDTFKNVTFTALPRELVGVIGAAGSGKSTLLQLIRDRVEERYSTCWRHPFLRLLRTLDFFH
ncbi:ABC tran domain containing protein [Asbolus verrucosus]|uniref:ABC tran domain containing protein n=1 Tax=Asbolus verrucosus TaxID=1661398 RepID=A0A482V8F3_ASBVE|nr:ABC tran domain containing protein [Asbolus verrucosus]